MTSVCEEARPLSGLYCLGPKRLDNKAVVDGCLCFLSEREYVHHVGKSGITSRKLSIQPCELVEPTWITQV